MIIGIFIWSFLGRISLSGDDYATMGEGEKLITSIFFGPFIFILNIIVDNIFFK